MNAPTPGSARGFQRFTVGEAKPASARDVEIASGPDGYTVRVDGAEHQITWRERPDGRVQASIGGRSLNARITKLDSGHWLVEWMGITRIYTVEDELAARTSRAQGARGAAADGPTTLAAPMPGTVVQVLATEGQAVAAGESLFIIEAMKMQNEIAAPITGRVTKMNVSPGQSVEARQPLCIITP